MEKTIEKTKTKPIEQPISNDTPLLKELEKLTIINNEKYTRNASGGTIKELNVKKGEITFYKADDSCEQIKISTSDEVLVYAPALRETFLFAKPVIFITEFTAFMDEGNEFYDEDSQSYEWEEYVRTYKNQNINIFWLLTSDNKPNSVHYLPVSDIIKSKGINLLKDNKELQGYNGVQNSQISLFLNKLEPVNLDEDRDEDRRGDSTISNITKTVFLDGIKYEGIEAIKLIKCPKHLYFGSLLEEDGVWDATIVRDKAIDYKFDNVETYFNNYNNQKNAYRIIMKYDKKFKKELPNFINTSYEYVNTRAGMQNVVYNTISALNIDSNSRTIRVTNYYSLAQEIPHPDCCGVFLPFRHNYSGCAWKVLPDSVLAKLYLFQLQRNKADKVIFLTSSQLVSIEGYNKLYGKTNVFRIGEFNNHNSGNDIFMYRLCVAERLADALNIDRKSGVFRTLVSNEISKYLPNNNTNMVFSQWFENSEEKVKETT